MMDVEKTTASKDKDDMDGVKKRGRPITRNSSQSVRSREYMSHYRQQKKKDLEWVEKNRKNQRRLEAKYRKAKRFKKQEPVLTSYLNHISETLPEVYSNPETLARAILNKFCIRACVTATQPTETSLDSETVL